MQRYFSFCLHWLLVLCTFISTVNAALPQSSTRHPTEESPLVIATPHAHGSDGLFTKPSSVTQEYVRQEEYRHKQVNPIARQEPLAALVQQQKSWEWYWQHIPPFRFLLFLPRKIAPSSSTDGPFFF